MRSVSIVGIGRTAVAEHWALSLRDLAAEAAEAAYVDADRIDSIDMLFVGNMLAGELSRQEQLGALVAETAGLSGIEAIRVEAGDASGGAALRQAYIAVAGGLAEVAMVLGVEKPTDIVGHERTSAFAYVLDAELEAELGATPAAMAGLLMRRYMHEYGYELADFGGFSVNAHANGARNQLAMYRNTLRAEKFTRAPVVADPVSLFDAAPEGDGAAALIITTTERARDMVSSPVAITGSALATDFLAVQNRRDPLFLSAAAESASKAYQQAGIAPDDVDLFEVHDSFTIMTTLALEAAGFAERGQGVALAQEDVIGLAGSLPLATFGGLKARGHAGGATGVLQTVEAVLQLRGAAGENQVPGARTAMVQGLAGTGATAVTHILQTI